MNTILIRVPKWDTFIEGAIIGLVFGVLILGIGWNINKWIKKNNN
jgi:hypothetical protein